MGIAVPCNNCKDRTLGCHSNCKNYKDFVDKRRQLKAKITSKKLNTLPMAKTTHVASALRKERR